MRKAHEIIIGSTADLFQMDKGFGLKGALTIGDFVLAGDKLVDSCRNWKWISEDSDLAVDYLPCTKQYLCSNKVKCIKLWEPRSQKCDSWNVLDDCTHETDEETSEDIAGLSDDEIADRIYRSYDVSITYDRYYGTPRIWLFGFSQLGLPITKDEMLMDVPTEYIGKTITVERHPFTGRLNLTIHPCYQVDVMNKLYGDQETYRPENVIILSLKLWSSILPSINLSEDLNFNARA